MTSCVSLAELAAAGMQLLPAEAVTIAAEMGRQHARGEIPGIPSPGIIRVTRDGEVLAQGPMTREEAGVSRAAHLLDDLLPGVDAPADYRASGGLRLVLARALGTLDLPPYASLDEFCAALTRFAGPDPVATARGLFRRWEERQVPAPAVAAPELTISDIRRARRATGWSLDDLSAVADVPAARLRELEWGYVRNWRADEDARNRVRRYARAAGLDEALVLSIAWPLIETGVTAAVIDEDEPAPVTALVRSGPQTIARIEPPAGRRARSGLVSSVLAIAVAALVALATFAIVMGSNPQSPNRHSQAPNPNAQTSNRSSQMPVPNSQRTVTVRAVRPVPSAAIAARAPNSRPAAGPRKRPAPQPRQAARPRSFFKKLFRIGIK
jgi:hypothetical protein